MKFEHCQKCGTQLEFKNKNKTPYNSGEIVFKENNEITFGRREETATIHMFHYCNGCYYNVLDLLESKGYVKYGLYTE